MMGSKRIKRLFVLGLVAVLVGLAAPGFAGPTVEDGWDLLTTIPVTSLGGVPFVGVPLGSFDFGGGPVPTGTTDTIVQRLAVAHAASETIPIELVALHLMSALPVDFGLGVGFYFVTLQSERGGPASPGQMTINFGPEGSPHGTFDSFFDVFFDVRLGGLAGPIALSGNAPLTSAGTPWDHSPPPGALEITGVNRFLNGTDRDADFWPVNAITEQHPGPPPTIHTVDVTRGRVPGPGGLVLLGIGLLAAAVYRGRLRLPRS